MVRNNIALIGKLGKAPETFTTYKGQYVLLSIATTDSYQDGKTKEWKDKETF